MAGITTMTASYKTLPDIFLGTDVVIEFSPDTNQADLNITGWDLEFQLKPYPQIAETVSVSKTTAAGITVTNAVLGIFQVSLAAEDTILLNSGKYYWEVARTTSPIRNVIAFGLVQLRDHVINTIP